MGKKVKIHHQTLTNQSSLSQNCTLHENVQIWRFFRSLFPVFRPNAGKYGPEKTPYLDNFHTGVEYNKKNQIDARRKAYIIINHNEYKKKIEMFIFVLRGLSLCFNDVQKKFLKFFVSYKINEKVTPLCVLLRKISGFLK